MPDSAPTVLAFDTSAAHCAAAVVRGDLVLAHRVEPMTRGQAERLFPLLDEMLAEAGMQWGDLAAIGVGTGPGNFTGIRISVAAARGLALGLGVPAIGVTATEAAAFDLPRPCHVVVPLRGDEVVWQEFPATEAAGEGNLAAIAQHGAALPQTAVPAALSQQGVFSDGPRLAMRAALPFGPAPLGPAWPLPVAIARIAAKRATRGPLPRPAPVYLRAADAAPPRDPPPPILP